MMMALAALLVAMPSVLPALRSLLYLVHGSCLALNSHAHLHVVHGPLNRHDVFGDADRQCRLRGATRDFAQAPHFTASSPPSSRHLPPANRQRSTTSSRPALD